MRRNDREIKDLDKKILIMKACNACRVAFFDKDYPYIVPLSFGIKVNDEKITLYFHGANEGKKVELMKQNPHVCFEMDAGHEFEFHEDACKSSMNYISIIGTGLASIVNDDEKEIALQAIMNQYVHNQEYHFNEQMLKHTYVWKIEVNTITGKSR